jgi:prevent-host-death family protein
MTRKKTMYNVHEAKTNLSRLLQQVAAGEEVVIAKAGAPVAKLVPMPKRNKPEMGFMRGRIWIADDFDAPLPPDLQKYFE